MSDQPPPPQHRIPPPQPVGRPATRTTAARNRNAIVGAVAIALAAAVVALGIVQADEPARPAVSADAELAVAFMNGTSADGVDAADRAEAARPLADAICGVARQSDDTEDFGLLLGINWGANQDSLSKLFQSRDSYALFAAAALNWRCSSQGLRLAS